MSGSRTGLAKSGFTTRMLGEAYTNPEMEADWEAFRCVQPRHVVAHNATRHPR